MTGIQMIDSQVISTERSEQKDGTTLWHAANSEADRRLVRRCQEGEEFPFEEFHFLLELGRQDPVIPVDIGDHVPRDRL